MIIFVFYEINNSIKSGLSHFPNTVTATTYINRSLIFLKENKYIFKHQNVNHQMKWLISDLIWIFKYHGLITLSNFELQVHIISLLIHHTYQLRKYLGSWLQSISRYYYWIFQSRNKPFFRKLPHTYANIYVLLENH